MRNTENLILQQDSYKLSHFKQYPPNTTRMFSYLESRGGEHEKTVFFGLQYLIQRYLSYGVTEHDVFEAADFAALHGVPFNYDGWMYIAHDLKGRLPVRIRAVLEGSVIPTSNVLMTVESTDPKVPWIVSSLETMLMRLWYPCTVATRSWYMREKIRGFLEATADDPSGELPFKLHDFGARGVSSAESAAIGGAAHLVNFMGSDTMEGIHFAQRFYGVVGCMPGYSIPASEHSTMTMWGKARETEAYANMLEQYKDQPIFACVSDSYDIYSAAADIWGNTLREKVIAFPGTVVIRPDSGDPVEVCARLALGLSRQFGATRNKKGYEVINHNVRLIQGDGCNPAMIVKILEKLKSMGFSATNIAFGMGGGLLQQLDRDTQKFAFKCSWAEVDGQGVDVHKDPVTDSGKRSKRGMLELNQVSTGEVHTVRRGDETKSLLQDVFVDGQIVREQTFDDVRKRAQLITYDQYRGWTDRTP